MRVTKTKTTKNGQPRIPDETAILTKKIYIVRSTAKTGRFYYQWLGDAYSLHVLHLNDNDVTKPMPPHVSTIKTAEPMPSSRYMLIVNFYELRIR